MNHAHAIERVHALGELPVRELRPYQADVRARVAQAWRAGRRRILLVAPTGAGKTRMMCSIVAGAMAKGRRVAWLTHRVELVLQASADLTREGVDHGIILSGHDRHPHRPMQVCSIQTLSVAGEAPPADIVMIDEAHHATAGTWKDIVNCYPSLELVLGATATPERGDRSPLGDVFEHMEIACTVRYLQEQGFLVHARVIAPSKKLSALSMSPVDAYMEHMRGKRALVFSATVNEARALVAEFAALGIRAAAVDGKTKDTVRALALKKLEAGELDVITNVFCLTEGTDIPPIEGIIIARGCSAWCTWIQMIGRGLRPSPLTGKTICTVVDLRGVVNQHGLPDDEREFSLTGIASKEIAALAALSQCRACGMTYRAGPPKCPGCGELLPLPRPARVVRRDLGEVNKDFKIASRAEQFDAFAKLEILRRQRGYAAKWPGVMFMRRFGFWPPFRADQVTG